MKQTKQEITVYIGADHAGFALKEELKKKLSDTFRMIDVGAKKVMPDDDYPDYAFAVAERVVKHSALGILICGSSGGVCIAANKVNGARAVSVWVAKSAKLARQDENANILCLAGRELTEAKAERIVRTFITTPFSNAERHIRRIQKITDYEQILLRKV